MLAKKIMWAFSGEKIHETMRNVGLDTDLKRHVRKCSLDMHQCLGLAQAIMENPDTLILDDPMIVQRYRYRRIP